jgi:YhcH/YjgK/YiaL family protein
MKKKPPLIEKGGKIIVPDNSIDIEEFYRQYLLNPGRWDRAISFLKETDLSALEQGRYELEGAELFAIINEYTTRNDEDTRLEAHRKYADIQYIIKGKEMIGFCSLSGTTVTVPYDEEKDIFFLESDDQRILQATPDRYFIFFPDDVHRPSIKAGETEIVKKAVVKVRLSEGLKV